MHTWSCCILTQFPKTKFNVYVTLALFIPLLSSLPSLIHLLTHSLALFCCCSSSVFPATEQRKTTVSLRIENVWLVQRFPTHFSNDVIRFRLHASSHTSSTKRFYRFNSTLSPSPTLLLSHALSIKLSDTKSVFNIDSIFYFKCRIKTYNNLRSRHTFIW